MATTENATSRRAIVDEVTEKLLEDLALQDAFDDHTIEKLAELAANGELSKPKKVEQVIKSASGRIQCSSSK